jgi:hypothetical protein
MLPERLILKSGNPFRVSLPHGERTSSRAGAPRAHSRAGSDRPYPMALSTRRRRHLSERGHLSRSAQCGRTSHRHRHHVRDVHR